MEVLKKKRESGLMMQETKDSLKVHKTTNSSEDTPPRPLPVPLANNQWILNITRQKSEEMLDGKEDGSFLFRETHKPNCLCTLVVMYNRYVHHISVRQNADGTLGLGVLKDNEPIFYNIQEIIQYYQKYQLKLILEGCVHGQVNLTKCDYYQGAGI